MTLPVNEEADTAHPAGQSDTQSLSKKRSHETMDAESERVSESSMRVVNEIDRAASQHQSPTSSTDLSMPPPLAPASARIMQPAQTPPRSGQGSQNTHSIQSQEAQPIPASYKVAETHRDAGPDDTDDADSPTLSPTGDAKDKIESFDWKDLEERYHDKIKDIDATEHDILSEFHNLCNYFNIWAQTGSAREVDRTFKRLKTQVTLVKHHEHELEQKRIHYIKVVDAFKSALDLLANS